MLAAVIGLLGREFADTKTRSCSCFTVRSRWNASESEHIKFIRLKCASDATLKVKIAKAPPVAFYHTHLPMEHFLNLTEMPRSLPVSGTKHGCNQLYSNVFLKQDEDAVNQRILSCMTHKGLEDNICSQCSVM